MLEESGARLLEGVARRVALLDALGSCQVDELQLRAAQRRRATWPAREAGTGGPTGLGTGVGPTALVHAG